MPLVFVTLLVGAPSVRRRLNDGAPTRSHILL
jgi:hypothetical protein